MKGNSTCISGHEFLLLGLSCGKFLFSRVFAVVQPVDLSTNAVLSGVHCYRLRACPDIVLVCFVPEHYNLCRSAPHGQATEQVHNNSITNNL